ncbi:hypothetical protein FNB15_05120 [Ferrovibrio terrae]|uniref:PAS domain-containing protein n=1 Tax=Ferrovibrio terrae TaxID=2594003 RepID=A0A516GYT5_9PROT|nr:hypothetical protein [Ferrovibrio terrae]QDO96698.1 hypothetical protein FNB15_05120 [Ferrovibrio terrae]
MAGADGITDFVYGVVDAPDQLQHPLIRRLHDDWLAATPPEGLPGHGFADPLRLSYLLGLLVVMDVVRPENAGDLRFRYRLVGTDVVARRRRDVTGDFMDQHFDPGVASTGPLVCGLAVEQRRPVYLTAMRHMFEKHYPLEYIVLPLVDAGGKIIDRLVAAQIYPPETPRLPYGSASV